MQSTGTPARADVAKISFGVTVIAAIFVAGIVVGHYQYFPFSILRAGRNALLEVLAERDMIAGLRPSEFIEPATHDGDGVTVNVPDEVSPGLTLIVSFFDGGNEIRLIELDGSVVARWPVRFSEIFPDTSHIQPDRAVPQSDWNVELHGAQALPDGSIVFNFESKGAVKLDRCGTVQWTLPRMTHHSIDFAADGGFWIPGRRWIPRGAEAPHPGIATPYYEESLMHVSDAGEVLKEISVAGLFYQSDLLGLFFSNGFPGTFFPTFEDLTEDLTHLNDIEELRADMQGDFPMFDVGDLLVSLRDRNLLMVVDPDTERIKWYQVGPWIAQHDPDFHPGGRISVLSNNDDREANGAALGGSTIIEMDVATRTSVVRYPTGGSPRWYTEIRGKHQYLDNGNILIAEAQQGRAFEVRPDGRLVWEYVNRYDEDEVLLVMDAIRYPRSYFHVEDWACS